MEQKEDIIQNEDVVITRTPDRIEVLCLRDREYLAFGAEMAGFFLTAVRAGDVWVWRRGADGSWDRQYGKSESAVMP